ncbi:DedA family protein [Antrihabitans cavernicola]|uniref:DedA family protein n=1 Tax=Antrihabitans cavernicola TaxID=2495913 RepID=A0A5A7S624_9NOCA|nr:DedA family protein [Spelaeibacter cavernicola]KAA0018987.1 DedA family protein [Spelaeibacter cavernicola]
MSTFAGGFEALETAGPLVVWAIVFTFVFLECALIVGLFLPGDSLLITAGIVLSSHAGSEQAWALSAGTMIAAVAGNQVGYVIGHRGGSKLLVRKEGKYLNTHNLHRVNVMLDRHGFWAVLISRWIPWVRTFCPLVAGAAKMDHRKYTIASTLGAIVWAPVLIMVGYYAGTFIERVSWLMPTVLAVMVVVLLAGIGVGVWHYRQEMAKEPESVTVDEVHSAHMR